MIKTKDIRLRPAIGNWYEYKPAKGYASDFNFGNLDTADINELLDLHYKFGCALADKLKEKLNISMELNETIVSQEKYSEFLGTHTGNLVSLTVDIGNGLDFGFLLDSRLAYSIINRLTGGTGETRKSAETLTDIEKIIIGTVLQEIILHYQRIWLGAFQIDNQGEIHSPKIKINDKIRKDAEILTFKLVLALGEKMTAGLEILFSTNSLEKIYDNYKNIKLSRPRRITVYLSPDSIKNVKVPAIVKIGTTSVTMQEILNLAVDDVFQLNEKLNDSVFLSIGEEAEFYGLLGKKHDKYAIKILEKKAKFYDINMTGSEQVVQAETQVGVKAKPVVETASVPEPESQLVVEEKVPEKVPQPNLQEEVLPEQKIELKDPLLEEFPVTAEAAKDKEDEEFVWDIDDLK